MTTKVGQVYTVQPKKTFPLLYRSKSYGLATLLLRRSNAVRCTTVKAIDLLLRSTKTQLQATVLYYAAWPHTALASYDQEIHTALTRRQC